MNHHLYPAVQVLAVGIAGGRHQDGRNPHSKEHVSHRLGPLIGKRPPLRFSAGPVGMTDHHDRRLAVRIVIPFSRLSGLDY